MNFRKGFLERTKIRLCALMMASILIIQLPEGKKEM